MDIIMDILRMYYGYITDIITDILRIYYEYYYGYYYGCIRSWLLKIDGWS